MKTLKQIPIALLSVIVLATGARFLMAEPIDYRKAALDGSLRFVTGKPSAPDAPSDQSSMVPDAIKQVLQLKRAKVGDETIIAYINKNGITYNLSAAQIIYLREQGISDAVITAMLNQPKPDLAGPAMLPIWRGAESAPPVQPSYTTTNPVTQNRDRKIYNWQKRHAEILEYNQTHQPEVVVIGDSIIHYWGGEPESPVAWAQEAWDSAFSGVTVENLGFGWDRTENVLWRIDHGELGGIAPKLIIILIGTNNRLINSEEEIAVGIEAVCARAHEKQPAAKILLLGILPRRDENSSPRPVISERVNQLLESRVGNRCWLTYCDFGRSFRNVDGSANGSLFQDGVHLNAAGYEILAGKIHEQIAALIGAAVTLKSDSRWANSLGMRFVPVPETKVMFSVWDTRVQDYRAFANANSKMMDAGKLGRDITDQADNVYANRMLDAMKMAQGHRVYTNANSNLDWSWQNPGFPQGETHPVVNVNWEDAKAFCAWLTKKEQAEGMIRSNMFYRLPTDAEWSVAVGLNEPDGGTPAEKDGKMSYVYPWGTHWPPPRGAGNYTPSCRVDNYAFTSPVGSFKPNQYGLYDMGGNVWQWCEDDYNGRSGDRVLRGASWSSGAPNYLSSSCRANRGPKHRFDYCGFRVVLETKKSQ